MKQSKSFLKIPTNRIIALVLLDVISTLIASFVAIYIRFDFSFEKIEKGYFTSLEHILIPNAVFTLVFFVIWKLYKSVWRYASTNELINILGATVSTTIAQMIYCSFTGNKIEAGKQYNIYITVYTPEEIVVNAELVRWTEVDGSELEF